ncbi:MAG TPA: hypothetical protein VEA69_16895 [Tepidisphaeraceae bacterium]|nr:hypothetical protein [Tepidisphaeraceae bacterium]
MPDDATTLIEPAAMTLADARAIVSDCLTHVWYREGLRDDPPASLAGYSLAQLVEANRIVRDDPGDRQPDGTTRVMMNCDDRLVAALYVATHYEPEDQRDATPIAILNNGGLFYIKGLE